MSAVEAIETSYQGEWWPLDEHDLPNGDDEKMPSQRHVLQMILLVRTIELHWQGRQDFFAGGDMFVYFNPDQRRTHDFKGPDVFVATGVERRVRESWVTWIEGKPPDVVIEVLSKTTAGEDKGAKRLIYQDKLRVPEYFWFNPRNGHMQGYRLINGVYVPIQPERKGCMLSERLGLLLVRWRGPYAEVEGRWLRWATRDGVLLPTPEEVAQAQSARAEQEQRRAEQEQRRAEQEQRRAEAAERQVLEERDRAQKLAERLRSLGIDPDL